MNEFRDKNFTSYKIKHFTLDKAYVVMERYNEGYSQYRRRDVHFNNIPYCPFPSIIK